MQNFGRPLWRGRSFGTCLQRSCWTRWCNQECQGSSKSVDSQRGDQARRHPAAEPEPFGALLCWLHALLHLQPSKVEWHQEHRDAWMGCCWDTHRMVWVHRDKDKGDEDVHHRREEDHVHALRSPSDWPFWECLGNDLEVSAGAPWVRDWAQALWASLSCTKAWWIFHQEVYHHGRGLCNVGWLSGIERRADDIAFHEGNYPGVVSKVRTDRKDKGHLRPSCPERWLDGMLLSGSHDGPDTGVVCYVAEHSLRSIQAGCNTFWMACEQAGDFADPHLWRQAGHTSKERCPFYTMVWSWWWSWGLWRAAWWVRVGRVT